LLALLRYLCLLHIPILLSIIYSQRFSTRHICASPFFVALAVLYLLGFRDCFWLSVSCCLLCIDFERFCSVFTVLHVTFVLLYHAAAGLFLRRCTRVLMSYAPALRLCTLNASCCFRLGHCCVLSLHSLRVRARAFALARASVSCLRARVRGRALHDTHSSYLLSFNLHTFLRFHTFVVSFRAFELTTSAVCSLYRSVCAVVRFTFLQTCSYILKRFLMLRFDNF
jgi:hypothetical protein